MENTSSTNPNINLDNYGDNYSYKLIDTCFKYFDNYIDKEKYEDEIDYFIKEFNECKPAETKYNIKIIIDFIDKNYQFDHNLLIENLRQFSIIHSHII